MRTDLYDSTTITSESTVQPVDDELYDYEEYTLEEFEEDLRLQKEQERELILTDEAEDTIIDLNDYYKKSSNVDEIPGMLATLRKLYESLPGTEWSCNRYEGNMVNTSCIHYKLKALALIMSKRYNRVKGHLPSDYPEYGANGWNYASSAPFNGKEEVKDEDVSTLYSLMGERIFNLWLQKVNQAMLGRERYTTIVVIETLGALAANRVPIDGSIISPVFLQQSIEKAVGKTLGESENPRSRQRAIGKAFRCRKPLVIWNQKENNFILSSTIINKMKYYS